MKILFYGTPQIAVPYLELLSSREQVVAAVTQPDKPAGRALKVQASPVKKRALELGIRVFDPKSPSAIGEDLKGLGPDLAVVVAYGRILKPDALGIPRLGTLNVHYSLLPKYRGAAPVQWALSRGETRTGITIFWLDEGMDTGPVLLARELGIGPEEDAPTLLERLTLSGIGALEEALDEIAAGRLRREPQSGTPSLAPLIKKDDARIRLAQSAGEIHNLVRGMRLWPRAFLDMRPPSPMRVLVLKTRMEPDSAPAVPASPGKIIRVEPGRGFLVQCAGSSRLWFLTVQPEGKKPVNAADFLNGLRLGAGDFLPVLER